MNGRGKGARFLAAGLVLVGALALSLIGVVPSGASPTAKGRVSAHLDKTSFTVAQARTVKLVCKFSATSSRFGYVLSMKRGSKWTKLKSVAKTGSFKGSKSMTVKTLFGSKPVKVGKYRVKVSADANSVTKSFSIKASGSSGGEGGIGGNPTPTPGSFSKMAPANGATSQQTTTALSWGRSSNASSYEYCIDATNDNTCAGSWVSAGTSTSVSPSGLTPEITYYWQVRAKNSSGQIVADSGTWWSFATWKPKAGSWTTNTNAHFIVSKDQTLIDTFTAVYSVENCGSVQFDAPDIPIQKGQFTTVGSGDSDYYVAGVFDSATTAHGQDDPTGISLSWCNTDVFNLNPISWTATWQSP